jgi:hypothetical protein
LCHEVNPVSEVRRPEPRSRGNDRPDGVTTTFQVSLNKVEPSVSVTRRNLLAKDRARSSLADEAEPLGPKMPRVICSASLAGDAEWLAWTGTRPDWTVIGPPGKSEGERPPSDAGEEVTRWRAVVCFKINDAPLVHNAIRQMVRRNQVAEPLRGEDVNLVVDTFIHLTDHPSGLVMP